MPSHLFEVTLRPDPLLHRVVIFAGVIAMLIGAFIITELTLHPLWQFVVGAAWTVDCLFELRRLSAGRAWLREISLNSGGEINALDVSGDNVPLTLRSGSVVLPELAWLSVADADGRVFAGLFARRRINRLDWHRLQLLWQQSRKAFGHPAGP